MSLLFGIPTGQVGPQGIQGPQGVSIQSFELTSGTHAPGTLDTYTLTLDNGQSFQLQVYNGADGLGSGDMLRSIYDTQNRNTDIFQYVDNQIAALKQQLTGVYITKPEGSNV